MIYTGNGANTTVRIIQVLNNDKVLIGPLSNPWDICMEVDMKDLKKDE